jgi:hypothetical protein
MDARLADRASPVSRRLQRLHQTDRHASVASVP